MADRKLVFKVDDVPLWETGDGEMRDQFVMTDEPAVRTISPAARTGCVPATKVPKTSTPSTRRSTRSAVEHYSSQTMNEVEPGDVVLPGPGEAPIR